MPAVKKSTPKRKAPVVSPALVSDPFTAAAASAKKAKKQLETNEDNKDVKIDDKGDEVTEIEQKEEVEVEKTKKEVKPKLAKSKPAKKGGKKESDDDENDGETTEPDSVKYNKEDFKLTSNNKPFNLKIVSWNINGIRAWIEKGGMEYLKAEEPDIFVCQETKCDTSKIPLKAELPNYTSYWLSGDTQGYSGVGLLTKIKPLKVTYGINNKKFDNEGRVICAEFEKFYLINTYIPNASRGLVRLPFRLEWEKAFRKFLSELEQQKPIIWCGDLNVAHERIDIRNPDTNLKSAGFTLEERQCFTDVLTDGYFDSFRYLYPDRVAYTYWSYLRNSRASNVGWRLDYFVLSEKLKENLVDNMVREKVMGSDHCPIALCLNV